MHIITVPPAISSAHTECITQALQNPTVDCITVWVHIFATGPEDALYR